MLAAGTLRTRERRTSRTRDFVKRPSLRRTSKTRAPARRRGVCADRSARAAAPGRAGEGGKAINRFDVRTPCVAQPSSTASESTVYAAAISLNFSCASSWLSGFLPGFLSGCHWIDSLRNAFLIARSSALRGTGPRHVFTLTSTSRPGRRVRCMDIIWIVCMRRSFPLVFRSSRADECILFDT